MRLVPVNSIRKGTILARSIYNDYGVPLLKAGCTIDEKLAKKALENGISAVYVHDGYSDKVIDDIISPEFRSKAIKTLKNCFDKIQNSVYNGYGRQDINNSVEDIKNLATELIDEILSRKDVLINVVDIKTMDNYTYEHCVNTAIIAIVTGIELGFNKRQLYSLAIGALLHDFGKVFIPKEILLKPDKLTDKEFRVIQNHPNFGYNYLKDKTLLDRITLSIILQHHEKINGTGYPNGCVQEDISVYAQIVSICDVYDALTSDRTYRKAMSPNEALELIMASCGSDFNLDLVQKFLRRIVPYPVGTVVSLSNGQVAIIKKINPEFVLRPIVEVIDNDNIYDLDLMEHNDLVITGLYEE